MAFTVCTANSIDNVKSYGLKRFLISLRLKDIIHRNIVQLAVDGNHDSKSYFDRKCSPCLDAKIAIFSCKGDNF